MTKEGGSPFSRGRAVRQSPLSEERRHQLSRKEMPTSKNQVGGKKRKNVETWEKKKRKEVPHARLVIGRGGYDGKRTLPISRSAGKATHPMGSMNHWEGKTKLGRRKIYLLGGAKFPTGEETTSFVAGGKGSIVLRRGSDVFYCIKIVASQLVREEDSHEGRKFIHSESPIGSPPKAILSAGNEKK